MLGIAIKLNLVKTAPSANPAPLSQPNKIVPNARQMPDFHYMSRSFFLELGDINYRLGAFGVYIE